MDEVVKIEEDEIDVKIEEDDPYQHIIPYEYRDYLEKHTEEQLESRKRPAESQNCKQHVTENHAATHTNINRSHEEECFSGFAKPTTKTVPSVGRNVYNCQLCQTSITEPSSISTNLRRSHATEHTDIMLYKCVRIDCNFKARHQPSMFNHQQLQHGILSPGMSSNKVELTIAQKLKIEKMLIQCFPELEKETEYLIGLLSNIQNDDKKFGHFGETESQNFSRSNMYPGLMNVTKRPMEITENWNISYVSNMERVQPLARELAIQFQKYVDSNNLSNAGNQSNSQGFKCPVDNCDMKTHHYANIYNHMNIDHPDIPGKRMKFAHEGQKGLKDMLSECVPWYSSWKETEDRCEYNCRLCNQQVVEIDMKSRCGRRNHALKHTDIEYICTASKCQFKTKEWNLLSNHQRHAHGMVYRTGLTREQDGKLDQITSICFPPMIEPKQEVEDEEVQIIDEKDVKVEETDDEIDVKIEEDDPYQHMIPYEYRDYLEKHSNEEDASDKIPKVELSEPETVSQGLPLETPKDSFMSEVESQLNLKSSECTVHSNQRPSPNIEVESQLDLKNSECTIHSNQHRPTVDNHVNHTLSSSDYDKIMIDGQKQNIPELTVEEKYEYYCRLCNQQVVEIDMKSRCGRRNHASKHIDIEYICTASKCQFKTKQLIFLNKHQKYAHGMGYRLLTAKTSGLMKEQEMELDQMMDRCFPEGVTIKEEDDSSYQHVPFEYQEQHTARERNEMEQSKWKGPKYQERSRYQSYECPIAGCGYSNWHRKNIIAHIDSKHQSSDQRKILTYEQKKDEYIPWYPSWKNTEDRCEYNCRLCNQQVVETDMKSRCGRRNHASKHADIEYICTASKCQFKTKEWNSLSDHQRHAHGISVYRMMTKEQDVKIAQMIEKCFPRDLKNKKRDYTVYEDHDYLKRHVGVWNEALTSYSARTADQGKQLEEIKDECFAEFERKKKSDNYF